MTPEGKAREIMDTLPQTQDSVVRAIAAAIREAVDEERAAIKSTVRGLLDSGTIHESAEMVIECIEARTNQPES